MKKISITDKFESILVSPDFFKDVSELSEKEIQDLRKMANEFLKLIAKRTKSEELESLVI
jgi:hypothetical protein